MLKDEFSIMVKTGKPNSLIRILYIIQKTDNMKRNTITGKRRNVHNKKGTSTMVYMSHNMVREIILITVKEMYSIRHNDPTIILEPS